MESLPSAGHPLVAEDIPLNMMDKVSCEAYNLVEETNK